MKRSLLPLLLPLAFAASTPAQAATSASRNGFTWEFDKDYEAGQFANGDWWVVGPVRITRITPADPTLTDALDLNGSMLNPKPNTSHGFTNQLPFVYMYYDRTKNIARSLPATIPAGSSLVSSVTPAATVKAISKAYGVLTVLDKAPPAGSFRPTLYGADKTIPGNVSDLDFKRLRTFAPVPSTPKLPEVRAKWGWPFVQNYSNWLNTHVINEQYPGYGRDLARQVAEAALMLNLRIPNEDKKPLLIDLLQMGVDVWGFVREGGVFEADGGHAIGRKLPMLMAGVMFRNDAMIAAAAGEKGKFQEDTQTFVISQADVGRTLSGGSPPYTAEQVGMAEWGIRHRANPGADNSLPTAPYRQVVGPAVPGIALAALMMDLRTPWAWEPFFLYVDRYCRELGKAQDFFVADMWNAYRAKVSDRPKAPTGLKVEPAP